MNRITGLGESRRCNGEQEVATVMANVQEKLERMHEVARKNRKELERFSTSKKFQLCLHGGPSHKIDMEESERMSNSTGVKQLVYADCPMCAEIAASSWLKRAGVPKLLLGATLDNWRVRTQADRLILKAVREFASDFKGTLVFWGKVGTGKSHLAVGVMRARGCGRMMTQNGFLLKLRQTYRDDEAEDIIETCKSESLLVLDEVGVSAGGRDEFPALYEVLTGRYDEALPTIVTTNLELGEFADAIGQRLTDRLLNASRAFEFTGDSWRGK